MTETSPVLIELVVPRPTPTPNMWLHQHWSRYRRIRKVWTTYIFAARLAARVQPPKFKRARLTIVRCSSRPIKDHDNLVGGLKPVIDGLVENGFIVSDAIDAIGEPQITQEKCAGRDARTIIRIEGLREP